MNKQRGYFYSGDLTNKEIKRLIPSDCSGVLFFAKIGVINWLDSQKTKFDELFYTSVRDAASEVLNYELDFKYLTELYRYFKVDGCFSSLVRKLADTIISDIGESEDL